MHHPFCLTLYRTKLASLRNEWVSFAPGETSSVTRQHGSRQKQTPEMQLRHATENHQRALAAVQDLEVKLSVETRWTNGSEEWTAAAVLTSQRRYQRCLDELEALVVSRIFELTRMNLSQTGEHALIVYQKCDIEL